MEHPTQAPPKQSFLGIALRGAVGAAIAGAVIGGIAGAALLGGLGAIGATAGAAEAVATFVGLSGPLAGSAALTGLAVGAAGGAILGAPAGAVAAPIYAKQKQTEALIPVVAQHAMQEGRAIGVEEGKQIGSLQKQGDHHIEQESTKYRDMITAQQSQQKSNDLAL